MNSWLQNMSVYLLIVFALLTLPVVSTQDKLESRRSELLREDNLFSFAFHKPMKESIKF